MFIQVKEYNEISTHTHTHRVNIERRGKGRVYNKTDAKHRRATNSALTL